jgi:DNA-binding NtrC family response regulator
MTGEKLPTFSGTAAPPPNWVLVLASHTNLRALLLRVLSLTGYTVLGCARLSEAEPTLRRFAPPGLILFDEMEPSEEALAQRLQQLSELLPPEAGCPLLILSAMHPLPRPQSLPGVVRVMPKPFHLAHLLSLVASQIAPLEERNPPCW